MLVETEDLNEFLFIEFKEGNESAFEHVFKANYDAIVGFCYQFIFDHDKAASLAQEAFINLWMNREKIESSNGIKSFLYTFAKSACLNFIRHQKVVKRYEDQHLHQMESNINAEVLNSFDFDSIEFTEMEELIYRAIDELPEKCKQVFMMSRFDAKKNKEIAEELQISVKSVEANITRALKQLSIKLAEFLPAVLVQLVIRYLS
ncbi:RNA polymerase sigma-70 factor [Carboxylicivirga linearis]|uniref:RNA polymerase sigma-70 factor n=1 Tax=Carboxylicivirga linearis TaxID=1628157 RepID=A0ABS5K0L2_9BACT|nr:RNA polymerase sigma-70 factor [Carboxylicivirga linearis]MBS2100664.1 RNA polymerase sigma-70 factor [Carboxylicivirga linearis]